MANEVAERPKRNTLGNRLQDEFGAYANMMKAVLPPTMQHQTDRLIKRCIVTVANGSWQLQKCSPESICKCALKAAEFGLAVDGRLGYAVPFKNKDRGYEATFIPGYLGLLAVARRSGTVKHAKFDVICENDLFDHGIVAGEPVFNHTYSLKKSRGDVIGAYCVLHLPSGDYDYEVMNREEIDAIRARSRASNDGPWVTDYNAMACKTVVRRILKRYAEDPGIIDLMDYDDEQTRHVAVDEERPASLSDLTDRLAASTDEPIDAGEIIEEATDEPAPPTQPAAKAETKAAPATELFDGDDPREFRHVLEEGDVKEAERRIGACGDAVRLLGWGHTIANSELKPDVVKRLGKLVDARVKKVEAGA